MITVTIEGSIGEGKTRIANVIHDYAEAMGLLCMSEHSATKAAIEEAKPRILIIEKVTR